MRRMSWIIIAACAVLAGCASGPPASMPPETGPRVSFAELSGHPENYQGQSKVVGGEVMQVEPLGQGSLLTVDQHDLDKNLFPYNPASGGTFLVETDEWLSPYSYQPKSKVTVNGVVAGRKNGLLLLKAKQIHLWEGPRWEKWYHPVPPEWYGYDPAMEYWFTPPYFDPWRGSGHR